MDGLNTCPACGLISDTWSDGQMNMKSIGKSNVNTDVEELNGNQSKCSQAIFEIHSLRDLLCLRVCVCACVCKKRTEKELCHWSR